MQLKVFVALLLLSSYCVADDHSHEYHEGEEVTVWLNKVGPYHNPQETYNYYSLPFCKPSGKKLKEKDDSLGVLLEGNDLHDSGILIEFKRPQPLTKLCDLTMDEDSAKIFNDAVKEHYWYQMYIDELPVWGMVGDFLEPEEAEGGNEEAQGFIYTHKDFSIAYNGDQIIEVNLTSENPQPIKAGASYPMTFSVSWMPTEKSYAKRFERYLDFEFFEHQIHWFSIFNSFMMVVFLCGLVALILSRTLKADYIRYTSEDDDLDLETVVDESGWKQVHGDVFRSPKRLMLFSAIVGTGWQLLALMASVISVVFLFSFYDDRGSIGSTLVACYALTTVVAGFASGRLYKQFDGKEWKQCMVVTATLFPGVCLAVAAVLNVFAVIYESTAAVSLYSAFTMLGIWLLVSLPLVLLGTLVGRSTAKPHNFPCRVNAGVRPIPEGYWYTKPWALALFSGVLPFGSIFIEMYFVFTSFWNYKFYYVYGFMFLVYVILAIVTICVTIVSTYFLLNAEDWRWHWTALFCGGSTAFYVYLYAIYYFFAKTHMSGFLQTTYYFGYMGILCLGLFILCGTIGYAGTTLFVKRIYQQIKSE